jgi:hypothetical protein
MAVNPRNRQRWRSILIGRAGKWLFMAVPDRLKGRLHGLLWRWLFLAEDGQLHRAGEILLADLRGFAFLDRPTIFDTDPLVMAYREGRRSVVVRMINYLNLDEEMVQRIMEVDDGI